MPKARADSKAIDPRSPLSCEYRTTFQVSFNDDDPDSFLYHFAGLITAFDDETDTDVEVGRWGVYYVDLRSARKVRTSVSEVMDAYHETLVCYEALFDPHDECFSSEVQIAVGGALPLMGNLLIIDKLDLDSIFKFQRRVELVRALIRRFTLGADLVALDDGAIGATVALRAGFIPIDDTDMMVRGTTAANLAGAREKERLTATAGQG